MQTNLTATLGDVPAPVGQVLEEVVTALREALGADPRSVVLVGHVG